MGQNSTRTFWISLGLAVMAMFLIYSYSQEKRAEYDKKYGATKRVVVATKDILEMSTIDDSMLTYEERPVDFIEPSAIGSPEDAVGLVAAAPIKAKEQILSTKLLTPGPNTGLALQVAPNKRALTIPIDEVRGVGKLVRPGDRIDIITSVDAGNSQKQRIEVKTILQDIPVLAVGPNITNNIPRSLELNGGNNKAQFRNLIGDLSFSSITIEVTPKDAQDIIYVLSSSPGSMYLALRNPNDRAINTLSTANVNTVLGRLSPDFAESARLPAATPPPVMVAPPVNRKPAPKKGPFVEVR